jgi:hypothetical protein
VTFLRTVIPLYPFGAKKADATSAIGLAASVQAHGKRSADPTQMASLIRPAIARAFSVPIESERGSGFLF